MSNSKQVKKNVTQPQRAVIYARGNPESIADQVMLGLEFCEENKMFPMRAYMAKGSSLKAKSRKTLQMAIKFCLAKKNKITTLIVSTIDRITRDMGDYTVIKKQLDVQGISIHLFANLTLEKGTQQTIMEKTLAMHGIRNGNVLVKNRDGRVYQHSVGI